MSCWKLFDLPTFESAFEKCQRILEMPGLQVGSIFLNVEGASVSELSQLQDFVTTSDFFLRGGLSSFEVLSTAMLEFEFSSLFLATYGVSPKAVLTLDAPSPLRRGWLHIVGSSTALKNAEELGAEVTLGLEDDFSVSFHDTKAISKYLQAASLDFRARIEQGQPFVASMTGAFQFIEKLASVGAICKSNSFKGFLGFGSIGIPCTNIDVIRIPAMVEALSRMAAGSVRLSWQIVGLGEKKYTSWNTLELSQGRAKSRKAVVRIISLSPVPAGLRRAVELRISL